MLFIYLSKQLKIEKKEMQTKFLGNTPNEVVDFILIFVLKYVTTNAFPPKRYWHFLTNKINVDMLIILYLY